MRARCMVYGCDSATYGKMGGIVLFHSFPREQARRKIWRKACRNPKLEDMNLDMSKICSLHFEKKYYRSSRKLLSSAIPTLNLPNSGLRSDDKNKRKVVYTARTKLTVNKTQFADDGISKNVVNDRKQTRSDCGSSTQTGSKSIIDELSSNNENEAERVFYGNNYPTVAKSIDIKTEIEDTHEVEIKKESREDDIAVKVQSTAAYDDDDDEIESVTFSSSEDDKSEEEPSKPDQLISEEVSVEITFKGETEDLTEEDDQDLQFEEQVPEPDTLSSDSDVQAIQPKMSDNNSLPKIDFPTLLPQITEVKSHVGTIEISPLTPTSSNQSRVETIAPAVDMTMDDENGDDCSTFAAHIKSRMRLFDREQKFIAQKLISDVMFMASTRQLQLGSAVVNPAPVMFMTTTANQLLGSAITTPTPAPPCSSKAVKLKSPANEKAKPVLTSVDDPPVKKRGKW